MWPVVRLQALSGLFQGLGQLPPLPLDLRHLAVKKCSVDRAASIQDQQAAPFLAKSAKSLSGVERPSRQRGETAGVCAVAGKKTVRVASMGC